jgi:protein-tyrosine phosphatase
VTPRLLTFVCLGNICRSPMAEAVMRHRVTAAGLDGSFVVDSAGTGDWHLGDDADRRARAALAERGYTLQHTARQFQSQWFPDRYLVLAMDDHNARDLRRLARASTDRGKIHLLRSFDPDADELAVPDPYYGDAKGFHHVLDIIETACDGLLEHLRSERGATT